MNALHLDRTTTRAIAAAVAVVAASLTIVAPIALARHYARADAPVVASVDDSQLAMRVVVTAHRAS